MNDQDRFPIRKHPRMADYDYSTPNYYFVTICTKDKKCIFGSAEGCNRWGKVAEEGIREISKHFSHVRVDKYIIMPNHIHAIIILEEGARALPTIIGQYKSYVTRKIHADNRKTAIWQTSFHDHVIRDHKSYEKIWNYIDGNLQKWQDDCYYLE